MAYEPCPACGSTKGPEHLCPGLSAQLLGRTLDGRYELATVLGQGGMGMVFQAIQTSIHRPVAVKTLHPALASAPQFFERFRREAEMASRLRHPNIITVFDFGRTGDGTCYFVMELLEGQSLKELVKANGPLPLRRAANIIEQAARGLGHAHKQNVVHRDVKPHNIMVQALDGEDFVKVLDFGLVKALEADDDAEQLTSTGQVLGTPQYMPPEQAGGETVDHRSDLYSLAGVFYYCLTGTSPFGANTVRKALTAALTKTVPPLATHRQGAAAPRELDEFFRKALAREKEDRYQSAEELCAELRAALAGCSDAELDALPRHGDGEDKADVGSGSHSGPGGNTEKGRAKGMATPSPSSASKRTPSKVIVEGTGASRSGWDSRKTTAGEIPSMKAPPLEADTQVSTVGPRSGRRVALFAVPVALLVAAGAMVWSLNGSAKSEPQPAPAPSPPLQALPQAPPPAAQPTPEEVTVKLVTHPPGARVLDDAGVLLGVTPLDRKWRKGELHTVRLQLQGHLEKRLPFNITSDQTLEVELDPAVQKPSRPVKKRATDDDDIKVFE